ncbi:hypothetical protein L1887_40258 [Cichorium endivia]|nr:hypothetical protein L1887_40258 [Cichorium endivia]
MSPLMLEPLKYDMPRLSLEIDGMVKIQPLAHVKEEIQIKVLIFDVGDGEVNDGASGTQSEMEGRDDEDSRRKEGRRAIDETTTICVKEDAYSRRQGRRYNCLVGDSSLGGRKRLVS